MENTQEQQHLKPRIKSIIGIQLHCPCLSLPLTSLAPLSLPITFSAHMCTCAELQDHLILCLVLLSEGEMLLMRPIIGGGRLIHKPLQSVLFPHKQS